MAYFAYQGLSEEDRVLDSEGSSAEVWVCLFLVASALQAP